MHDFPTFGDWVLESEDYKKWKEETEQSGSFSTSVNTFLDSLDEDALEELKEDYDKYCDELRYKKHSKNDED